MVDYGLVALAIGGIAIAVFALYSLIVRSRASRRLGQIDLVVGVIGLVYVWIVVTNGGFIFLIGAVGAIVLVALGALAVRQGSNPAPRA